MNLKKIFAAFAATAVAATMAVSASAYTVDNTDAPNPLNSFDLAAPASGAVGEKSTNSSQIVTANYELPVEAVDTVKQAVINLTVIDVNSQAGDGTNPGWGNFQWYAAGLEWNSGYANTNETSVQEGQYYLKADSTLDITIPFTPATTDDGSATVYSVGFTEYGGGSYVINYVSFQDADGNELYKWTDIEETKPADTTPADTTPADTTPAETAPAGDDDTTTKNPTTGATAGLALAGLALAGAAIVATKKIK